MEVTQSGADTGTPGPLSVAEAAQKLNGLFAEKPKEKPDNDTSQEEEQNSEVEAEASAESSETDTEATEEAEGQEDHESQDDSDGAPPEMLTALSDVAKKLGLEESKLYDIKVPIKVDGKDGEATLSDVIRRYQTDAHLTHEGMKVADLKKEAEKRIESIEIERQQRLGTLEQAAQITQHLLLGEYKNINWEELRKTDSIGYLEKKAQYEEYNHSLNQINAAIQAERQKDQEAKLTQLKTFIKEQQDKLVNAIPEWKDQAVQKKEYTELLDFLRNDFQVSKDEIDTILDHRIYLMARDAKKYRELQKKNPRVENKDRTPPKIVKSGNGKPSASAKTVELKKQFAQKRDVKSAGAYINSLIKKR